MTMTNLYRPEPLDVFLDRGGNPRVELGGEWVFLVECISNEVDTDTASRADFIRLERAEVEAVLNGEPLMIKGPGGLVPWPLPDTQERLTLAAWSADLVENYDVLVPRVRAFLTDAEHTDLTVLLWDLAHPHPLGVERQDSGSCHACDTPFGAGELAMILAGDDSQAGAWCYGCVTIVVEALKAAQGS